MSSPRLPEPYDQPARPGPPAPAEASAFPAPEVPPEGSLDLRGLWWTLRRQRWVIVGATVGALTFATLYTWARVPVWRASTFISMTERDPSTLTALDVLVRLQRRGSEIETDMHILRTRPIAEEVVDGLDLNFRVERPKEVPRSLLFAELAFDRATPHAQYSLGRVAGDRFRLERLGGAGGEAREVRTGERLEIPGGYFVLGSLDSVPEGRSVTEIRFRTLPFQGAVRDLSGALVVTRPDREANLVELAYEGTDRRLVQQVPNAVAEAFMAQRQVVQKTEVRSTVSFLREQSRLLQTQLEAAERELQDFREGRRIVALAAEAEEQVKRLADLQTRRTQLDAERTALANLLASIDARSGPPDYRKLAAFPTFLGNQAIADLLQGLTAAERARTELSVRMTADHPDMQALDRQIADLEGQLGDIGRNYLTALTDQIASLDSVLARFGSELEEIPAREVQFARLERQTRLLGELYTLLQTRLKEAEIAEAVEDPRVRVVEAAVLPDRPVSPQPLRNLAVAGIIGMMLGVALALGREYLDTRIREGDDVEYDFGVPAIGRIPFLRIANGRSSHATSLVTLAASTSAGAEAFRTLRTNVRFVRGGAGSREMVITSPGPREGKSVTSANLAAALAQQGMRTLLIDADMRRAVQHFQFGVSREPGLSDLLTRSGTLDDSVRRTDLERLDLLPAGRAAPNPSELLGGARMSELLERSRELYEAVVIDSPPILAVTDAAVLGRRVEGVVLVVRAGQTHREAAASAIAQLRRVGATLLGVVLNDARGSDSYGYGYYGAYYGGEDAPRPRWKRLVSFDR